MARLRELLFPLIIALLRWAVEQDLFSNHAADGHQDVFDKLIDQRERREKRRKPSGSRRNSHS